MTILVTDDPPEAAALRHRLVDELAQAGVLRSPGWRTAFEAVPRHVFLPTYRHRLPSGAPEWLDGRVDEQRGRWLDVAYTDDSLVTLTADGEPARSSSTQPGVMAAMLEALDVHHGHRVLEIGAGTGYNAALLCHRLGDQAVTTVDVEPELVEQARAALDAAGYHPTVVAADGLRGWPAGAPYDRVIATCSTVRVPLAWLRQTRTGGIIIANVGFGVVPLAMRDDGSASGRFLPGVAAFIEARPADADPPLSIGEAVDIVAGEPQRTGGFVQLDLTDDFWFVFEIVRPGLTRFELNDDALLAQCLVDGATGSWSYALTTPDGRRILRESGPRQLRSELAATHRAWAEAGRPSHDQIELTVSADGAHELSVTGRPFALLAR